MAMNLLKHVMIRIGSSLLAYVAYVILISLVFLSESIGFFGTFVFYLVFGFFAGSIGVLILAFVSLFIDIPLNKLLLRFKIPSIIIFYLKTFLYFICGALIAFFVYGNENFLIASGAIVSVFFYIIFTVLWRLNEV